MGGEDQRGGVCGGGCEGGTDKRGREPLPIRIGHVEGVEHHVRAACRRNDGFTIARIDLDDFSPRRRAPGRAAAHQACDLPSRVLECLRGRAAKSDRKSTRLNSSHQIISYAVFCLKKKKKQK